MKKFLMATDLSARSDRAVERAVMLAQEHDASLTIVHVIDDELPAALADAQEDAAKQAIDEHVDKLAAGNRDRISIEVVSGRAHADILDMSEKIEAEMVILGMHREDAFKDRFRGTTAERIIRAGGVPVLMAKDRVIHPYKRVIVGVDFSVHSRRAVEFAVRFVPSGEFHLVHAYGVPFEGFLYGHDTKRQVAQLHEVEFEKMMDEEMSTFLASLDDKAAGVERVMKQGTVREVIFDQARRLKPDLVVMGTHGRTGIAHAFLGSVAEDLLRAPPCDVLAVKAF